MIDESLITRAFQPAYPWVLVRVLHREQKVGSIILVDGPKQNKPVLEGVVLATWLPKERPVKGGGTVTLASELKPGGHVLFPHWAGLPVVGFDIKDYRIVRELDWREDNQGGIFATLEEGESQEKALASALFDVMLEIGPRSSDDYAKDLAEALLKRYIVVDRDKPSVTLSGL